MLIKYLCFYIAAISKGGRKCAGDGAAILRAVKETLLCSVTLLSIKKQKQHLLELDSEGRKYIHIRK